MKINLEIHLTSDRHKALARSITHRYGLECPIDYDMPKERYIEKQIPMYNIGESISSRYIFYY
jgi:hypothetical protein